LKSDRRRVPYLDIASAASPWTKLLRAMGREAYSIDLEKSSQFAELDYYLEGDATATTFASGSIGSASLQCAFEMFHGDADTRLISELARLLRPGGRAVVCPLYMHTHSCFYQSPEHYGKTSVDPGATRYVRRNASRVPSSRKYSAETLASRVWKPAVAAELQPRLYALRNGPAIGSGIYLHFILVLDKPADAKQP
jgi:SAM-dependent methyltransferase